MKRSQFVALACTLASALPLAFMVKAQDNDAKVAAAEVAKTIIVTEVNNGAGVMLNEDEILVVRLKVTPGTGYSRALVTFPNMPVRLISHRILAAAPAGDVPVVGAPVISEWRFEVADKASYGKAVWLKFLQLQPFARGIDNANLWEIKVTVPQQ